MKDDSPRAEDVRYGVEMVVGMRGNLGIDLVLSGETVDVRLHLDPPSARRLALGLFQDANLIDGGYSLE